ncbi:MULTISPECIES: hypothetical protein [Rhodobacterales]|uniref:hypothetical protein n=1 Tax=Rhodobacterales TaxID=204455 RepID=UPI0011C44BE2|nr:MULTISPECIES: hypothetical protein [Rhodobacterales]
MKTRIGILIGLALFLTACVETAPTSINSAAEDISIETDRFSGETTIRSPLYLSRQGFTDTFPVKLAYEASLDDDGELRFVRLYVVATRTEWGFYSSAIGEDNYEFAFSEVDRQVDSIGAIVTVEEHFLLTVPLAQLASMSSTDYEIRVYGRRDSGVFVVPSAVTNAFLQRLNSL